ncbi:MAG: phosphoribosylglycinamide formyltransferase [Flavobacteriales bacterium]|nr:phosphoribosylglycinamide formyltransferase [Flavobacteriales bacterium]
MINLNLQILKNKNIVIFASGSGSNARCIIDHFSDQSKKVEVSLVVSNKTTAGVLDIAKEREVKTRVIKRSDLSSPEFLSEIVGMDPNLIVLAGFLLKIPQEMINTFRGKIVNIHPSLLPKFGGKGMYGMNVHKAVHTAGEGQSGCTVHWVNENYDEGAIIAQNKCDIVSKDSPEDIAKKVLSLEHKTYATTIEKLLKNDF